MSAFNCYYDLKNEVETLSASEEKNWLAYENFVNERLAYKNELKTKTLDYINQLGFLKREIEKKILEEYKKIESLDTPIAAFLLQR